MKILITANSTWNIYNFRMNLIKDFINLGYEICVVSPKDEYFEEIIKLNLSYYDIPIYPHSINPFREFTVIKKYYDIIKKLNPDIILGYTIKPNIYVNLCARILDKKVVSNISGLGKIFIKKTYLTFFGIFLYRIALKNTSHVFFQNSADLKLFLDLKIVKNYNSSVINGSGVDVNVFDCIREKNDGKSFLFLGRLIKEKGILEFLDAVANVLSLNIYNKTTFYIAGSINLNQDENIKKKLDLFCYKFPQIKYLGNQKDIVQLLKEVDVLVLPSYREGLSKALIEGASMKLPLITTDVPGCKDIVENGKNGFLCEKENSKSLSEKIIKMINLSSDERMEFGICGRNLVINKFASKHINNEYYSIIESLAY